MTNFYENTELFIEFISFLNPPDNTAGEADDHECIEVFHEFLTEQCLAFYRKHRLEPMLCTSSDGKVNHNLEVVYECFIHDVNRMMEDSLPNESGKPDHFKRAGILAYWLRRNPIAYAFVVKEHSPSDMYNEFPSETFPPDDIFDILTRIKSEPENMEEIKEKYFPWYLMSRYHQAYFAFNVGWQISKFFECRGKKKPKPKMSNDFLHMACHFIKYKNVSPHGLMMIYQALHQNTTPKK